MRWLLILGLCLDGVGATLIAWPLIRPAPASREHGLMRIGGNPWQAFMRADESRFVQIGALFLAFGFALQAVGSIVGLSSWRFLAVILVAGIVAVGVLLGVWVARRGQPSYVTFPEDADVIRDQRHSYNVATVDELNALVVPYVRERHGRAPIRLSERATASIGAGQWRASCPACGRGTVIAAWPLNPDAICTDRGHVFGVDFPPEDERQEIERLLLLRPHRDRNWTADQSIEDLRQENRELHGIADA